MKIELSFESVEAMDNFFRNINAKKFSPEDATMSPSEVEKLTSDFRKYYDKKPMVLYPQTTQSQEKESGLSLLYPILTIQIIILIIVIIILKSI